MSPVGGGAGGCFPQPGTLPATGLHPLSRKSSTESPKCHASEERKLRFRNPGRGELTGKEKVQPALTAGERGERAREREQSARRPARQRGFPLLEPRVQAPSLPVHRLGASGLASQATGTSNLNPQSRARCSNANSQQLVRGSPSSVS